MPSSVFGACEGRACCAGADAADGDAGNDEFVQGTRGGREGRRVEVGEQAFGIVETADEDEAADFKIARMRRVELIAVFLERHACCMERFCGPAQIACGEGDLSFGDDAARACYGFLWGERARR